MKNQCRLASSSATFELRFLGRTGIGRIDVGCLTSKIGLGKLQPNWGYRNTRTKSIATFKDISVRNR
jgi:hypothetical protein